MKGKWARDNPEFETLLIECDWGALVRFARTAARLDQYHLAYALGLSQSALSRVESSIHPPTIRTLARVAVETRSVLEVVMRHAGDRPGDDSPSEFVGFDGRRYAAKRADERRERYRAQQQALALQTNPNRAKEY